MNDRLPIRQPPLADQVLDILTQRIKDRIYPPGSRLPPENQLAEEFNVSRATVRSALKVLSSKRLIVRRQGVGTFVSRLSTISNPLNEFIDFNDLIIENGFEPDFFQVHQAFTEADPAVAEKLQVEPGSRVLNIHKVFTADGEPIIYVINNIPTWVFDHVLMDKEALQEGITEPLFGFFEDLCHQKIQYSISSIQTDLYKNCNLRNSLNIEDPNTPFLIIDDVGFNQDDRPVHHSIEFHPSSHMHFDIIRHRRRGI